MATQNQNTSLMCFGFVLPTSYWQPICIYPVPGSHKLLATPFRVLAHQVDGLGITYIDMALAHLQPVVIFEICVSGHRASFFLKPHPEHDTNLKTVHKVNVRSPASYYAIRY